ncbi:hypothetical protein DPMN_128755 [Dreissena polymorpha]|uniref:Uncharacterized protein n=1 Tax=Dreissena polymorpha TaxID=45954 RepID=A0A9D4H3Q8_DREPO|nr:hypothetical protein DPMN_128755 [Dreissena polymorpha]
MRFDPVDEIRSVHHVHGDEPGVVHVKAETCFSCDQCIIGNYPYFENEDFTEESR